MTEKKSTKGKAAEATSQADAPAEGKAKATSQADAPAKGKGKGKAAPAKKKKSVGFWIGITTGAIAVRLVGVGQVIEHRQRFGEIRGVQEAGLRQSHVDERRLHRSQHDALRALRIDRFSYFFRSRHSVSLCQILKNYRALRQIEKGRVGSEKFWRPEKESLMPAV